MAAEHVTGHTVSGGPRERFESPAPVDWVLVRRLHATAATALAEELKRRPTLSAGAQQELAAP